MPAQEHDFIVKQPGNYSPIAKKDSADENGYSPCPLWAPFFLRRPIMVLFLASFLSCLAALVALYVYSQRQDRSLGIKTDGDRYYYLWTYGPTAVFTIFTAGWTQAEYRACQLMPWVLMLRGPTPASQSIFLDYLSKLNVVSLYQSLRHRHLLVSLCVAGSLILNGITVLSTGLFELDSVLIARPSNLTVSHKFDYASFDPRSQSAKAYAQCMAFFGLNMTRPVGLYGDYVYTPFQPAESYSLGNDTIPADRSYEANLQVIEPSFDCQNATITWKYAKKRGYRDLAIYTTPDGCRLEQFSPPFPMMTSDFNIGLQWSLGGCQHQRSNETEVSELESYTTNWDADLRLWAAIGPSVIYGMSPNEAREALDTTVWEKHPLHVTVCKLRYTVYQGPVRIWREDGQNAISAHIERDSLNITEVITGVQASKLLYSGFQSASTNGLWDDQMAGDQFTFAADGKSRNDFWANMTLFNNVITRSLSCLVQQTVKDQVLQIDPHHVEGTGKWFVKRLFLRQMSFFLMASLLVLLITIVIILLCFFIPVAVCPRDVGSIGGLATVFSRSSEFMDAFCGSQCKSEEEMAQSKLGQAQYSTLIDPKGAFMLVPQDQSSLQSIESSDDKDSSPTWWKPFSTTFFIRTTVVLIPIAVIIGLEVVYHISTSERGITLVDGKSPYIHYLWVYIPALVMFIIRCLFTSVEFGTRTVQPYSRLWEGRAPPETTILENQLRKIAPYAVFDTLRKQQWSPAAATISLFLATLNPIVVSGLFTTKVSGPTSPVNLTQITRWNLGDPASPGHDMSYWESHDFITDSTAGLILNFNYSDPQWTYNNLAFPQFKLADTDHLSPNTGSLDARIPALRSRFICAPDPANGGCEIRRGGLWCELYSPCFVRVSGGSIANEIDYVLASPFKLSGNAPSNCSTHAFLYLKKGPNNAASTDYHYIYCNATIEEVEVDTKFQLPSLSIDTDTPPRVVEGSARTPFNTTRHTFPSLHDLKDLLFKSDPTFNDAILEAVSNGINGVPLDELLDPEKLSNRLSAVWGIIIAQLLDTNARESFDDPFNATYFVEPAIMEAPIYTGVFHDGRNYLVQNELSTRILDGLLGSMVICALIALYVMRTDGILPKSPTSIASVASLLYGSRILDSFMPHGSEWQSDEELKERGVFEGRSFSMGWWEVKRQRIRNGSGASSVSTLAEDETPARDSFDRMPTPPSGHDGGEQRIRFGIDADTADTLVLRDISRI
ncbi:hypothetical protein N7457_005796 [Penicillium paradoxum]|uniref:uncharacterized protein n=1 Tax=Penicillium paradoxum TaxID=176176 RepID=UPI0025483A90|nr:uncharacterized protein N7457_005796 [Penicillium paradoxum]KAJ5780636.1 hypothetical protein N7457_005796 [Penicillium paradoxum]